jgi:hypothetical protein
MGYSALDHWRAHTPLPRGAFAKDEPLRNDPAGGPVRDMLWSRLLDSLVYGGVLWTTLEWSVVLNQVPAWLGGGSEELLRRTRVELDRLRNHIDAGEPWPIGLIFTERSLWDQHQVLAYGYEPRGQSVDIFVYDSNRPRQYGDPSELRLNVDLSGRSLSARFVCQCPTDDVTETGELRGFFCSGYTPAFPPAGLATRYGRFVRDGSAPQVWLMAGGARFPISAPADLAAFGATPSDVRTTNETPMSRPRPRDGIMLQERTKVPIFLFQSGGCFTLPDTTWIDRFGGVDAVWPVPDGTLRRVVGPPCEGALLREWSDPKVYAIESGKRRWVTTPQLLAARGGWGAVRLVPDGGLAAIPVGSILPEPFPGECEWLATRITELEAEVASLEELIAEAEDPDNPRPTTRLRAALIRATSDLAPPRDRSLVLACP